MRCPVTATDAKTPLALLGIGKIARDQHVPALANSPDFALAATVSRSGGLDGVENHADAAALLAARPDIPALSLCMPPLPRYEIARAALLAGRHVMLEKPPGATVSEVLQLRDLAAAQGVSLCASWHSRHAAAVAPARDWLAGQRVRRVQITWREDVRHWHPGQDWIWEPGGLGVFDPGINALSILTAILPVPVRLTGAELRFPENRAQPIAAALTMTGAGGLEVAADFDWRQEGPQTWDITAETDAGTLRLSQGGACLEIAGKEQALEDLGEYPGLYSHFAGLIAAGQSDVDPRPLMLVADAFLLGRHLRTEAFYD